MSNQQWPPSSSGASTIPEIQYAFNGQYQQQSIAYVPKAESNVKQSPAEQTQSVNTIVSTILSQHKSELDNMPTSVTRKRPHPAAASVTSLSTTPTHTHGPRVVHIQRPYVPPTTTQNSYVSQKVTTTLLKPKIEPDAGPSIRSVPPTTPANNSKVLCTICNKWYAHKKGLREHQMAIHSNQKFECPGCKLTFSRRSSWKRHVLLCQKSADENDASTSKATQNQQQQLNYNVAPYHANDVLNLAPSQTLQFVQYQNMVVPQIVQQSQNNQLTTDIQYQPSYQAVYTPAVKFESGSQQPTTTQQYIIQHFNTPIQTQQPVIGEIINQGSYQQQRSMMPPPPAHQTPNNKAMEIRIEKAPDHQSPDQWQEDMDKAKFKCLACDNTYSRRHQLTKHNCQPLEVPMVCPKCFARYKSNSAYSRHFKSCSDRKVPDADGIKYDLMRIINNKYAWVETIRTHYASERTITLDDMCQRQLSLAIFGPSSREKSSPFESPEARAAFDFVSDFVEEIHDNKKGATVAIIVDDDDNSEILTANAARLINAWENVDVQDDDVKIDVVDINDDAYMSESTKSPHEKLSPSSSTDYHPQSDFLNPSTA